MRLTKGFRIALLCCAVILALLSAILLYTMFYTDPYHQTLQKLSVVETQAQIGEVSFHYAEGPDNGPPLFSSEADRIAGTIADRSFATCGSFLREEPSEDFLSYWLRSNAAFFENNFGKGVLPLLKAAVCLKRADPFNDAMEIWFLPDVGEMLLRGFALYDPRFGAAFHDGSWNEGFDHAQALRTITCPVLLLQANYTVLEDGTLNGAMTDEDAAYAMSLLQNGTYCRIDASHVIALDRPDAYETLVREFFR